MYKELVHAISIIPCHQNHLDVLSKSTGEGEKTKERHTDIESHISFMRTRV
jgi:hypothetical protein